MNTKAKKIFYGEGTVFNVPLTTTGYARGIIARGSKETILFGYFFGPKLVENEASQMQDLMPDAAILKARFGDLGLLQGEWGIVGQLPGWNRKQWPMPDFVRNDPLVRLRSHLIRYSDADPSKIEFRQVIKDGEGLLNDVLSGSGAIEIKLTNILENKL